MDNYDDDDVEMVMVTRVNYEGAIPFKCKSPKYRGFGI